MTEDLVPSQRQTARGLSFRRRSRIMPGPLRPARTRGPGGVAAGMLTGALLGLAFLAAFTLPFVRVGGAPAGTGPGPDRAAGRTSAAQPDRAPAEAGRVWAAGSAVDPDAPDPAPGRGN